MNDLAKSLIFNAIRKKVDKYVSEKPKDTL